MLNNVVIIIFGRGSKAGLAFWNLTQMFHFTSSHRIIGFLKFSDIGFWWPPPVVLYLLFAVSWLPGKLSRYRLAFALLSVLQRDTTVSRGRELASLVLEAEKSQAGWLTVSRLGKLAVELSTNLETSQPCRILVHRFSTCGPWLLQGSHIQ